MKTNKFIELLKANKMANMGKVVNKVQPEPVVRDEDLSLKELRIKYPHITSNSVAGFLKKLNG